jgi:hypothetical protein
MPIVGSAWVLLTPDGYNNQQSCGKGCLEINITLFDGRSYTAKLVGSDPLTDLGHSN